MGLPAPNWFICRLRGLQGPNLHAGWQDVSWREWGPPDSIVRGESFHEAELRAVAGSPRRQGHLVPVDVTLRREPDNAFDSDAVRIEIGGDLVGYVAKELAASLAWLMDGLACPRWQVAGLVRGGYTKAPDLGVMLWLGKRTTEGPLVPVARHWRAPNWPPQQTEGLPIKNVRVPS